MLVYINGIFFSFSGIILANVGKSPPKNNHSKEKQPYSVNVSDEKRSEIRSDLKYLDLKYRDVMHELKYLEKSKPAVHNE